MNFLGKYGLYLKNIINNNNIKLDKKNGIPTLINSINIICFNCIYYYFVLFKNINISFTNIF